MGEATKTSARETNEAKAGANGRSGRPPRELAGEVEERILCAARQAFLDHGFEGASIDKIAVAARSGKATIYARYPNKQALFAAAITRYGLAKQDRLQNYRPVGKTIEERFASIGVAFIQEILTTEWIGLLRLGIAEESRFPEYGTVIIGTMRQRGGDTMARLISEAADLDDLAKLPALRPDRLAKTARYFRDLILYPLLMRALVGESLESLRAEIAPHVSERVAFFLDACR
jgi:AcrR family transcriptional regulator